jgi:hypothetical protein
MLLLIIFSGPPQFSVSIPVLPPLPRLAVPLLVLLVSLPCSCKCLEDIDSVVFFMTCMAGIVKAREESVGRFERDKERR